MKSRFKLSSALLVAAAIALVGCAGGAKNTKEIATTSDQTQLQNRAMIRLQLAVGYLGQRQLEVALDEVKQALQSDPEFADAYLVRALIYIEMKETALAEENFMRALRLAPNNPEFNNNFGWFLCENKRENDAMKYFDAALKVQSYASPEKALNNAGKCALKMQKRDVAEEYFRRAFRLDPGFTPTNVNLASLYYEKRDYERAQFYLSRVTKTGRPDELPADVLWLAIRLERKLGDSGAEAALVTQLRRHHASSPEFRAWQRGAFDE